MLISKIIQHMDIDLKEVVRLLKIVDSYEAKRSEIERIYENIGISLCKRTVCKTLIFRYIPDYMYIIGNQIAFVLVA